MQVWLSLTRDEELEVTRRPTRTGRPRLGKRMDGLDVSEAAEHIPWEQAEADTLGSHPGERDFNLEEAGKSEYRV